MKTELAHLSVLLTLLLPVKAAQTPKRMEELVAAERKFSETCGKVGIRDSFLMFFADDVITFGTTLRRGKTYLQQRPPEGAGAPKLRWEPVYCDISASGDLGYTTGPYTFTTKTGETYYGIFFSIWKKQSDGQWKVIVDAGEDTPKPNDTGPQEFQIAASQAQPSASRRINRESARARLLQVEQRIAERAESEGLGSALLTYAAVNLRIHRANIFPLGQSNEVSKYLKEHDSTYELKPLEVGLADSADLGYTIGHYRSTGKTEASPEEGYYVRVWKTDASGNWRLVVDSLHQVAKG